MKRRWAGVISTTTSVTLTVSVTPGIPFLQLLKVNLPSMISCVIVTLLFSGAKMETYGSGERHHHKFLKVLEQHSFKTTWQFQRLKTIHQDMKSITKSGIWPYTSYSPVSYQKSILGDMSDISPEELRFLRYTSSEEEYVEYEKTLETDYLEMREDLMMDIWQSSIDDPDERIMLYLETEVYISVKKKKNGNVVLGYNFARF